MTNYLPESLPGILRGAGVPALALAAALASTPAAAEGLDLTGSLGDDGFSRYVPPVTNPLFNETPFITTEARPIYIYHHIPDDFLTGGGNANVVALQARVALTERLGFIATADGYSWLDFDNTLPDDSGLNDITAGLKYAVISDPEAGSIATLGARYTIPVGTLKTGGWNSTAPATATWMSSPLRLSCSAISSSRARSGRIWRSRTIIGASCTPRPTRIMR